MRGMVVLILLWASVVFLPRVEAANLVSNGNGTVTDTRTGLTWQQGEPGTMKWGAALAYCNDLSLGGHSDWRLPSVTELESLTDDSRCSPAIDKTFFPLASASDYRSSTTDSYSPGNAWNVNFSYGSAGDRTKDGDYYVRCVRGGKSGSLVPFDHFEITFENGGAICDKAVDQRFPITITARKADGTVKTDCAGEVFLSSRSGNLTPYRSPLSPGGTTTLYVSIGAPGGKDTAIAAMGCGLSGYSNIFNVCDSTGCRGHLAGTVVDGATGAAVAGATVYLDTASVSQVTDSAGNFQFSNVVSGYHSLRAEQADKTGKTDSVYVASNSFTTEKVLLYPACTTGGKTPVLLVPGIMGSAWKESRLDIIPTLQRHASPDPGDTKLVLYDSSATGYGWTAVKDELDARGYTDGCTRFDAPFDWRKDIDGSAEKYLRYWIEVAKEVSGSSKVNIIAHSQGGLLSRAYIRNGGTDVDRLAMIGTPNHGSAKPYFLWEGGDPVSLTRATSEPIYTLLSTYLAFGSSLLGSTATSPLTVSRSIPGYQQRVFSYMRSAVPSMNQLMGTYAYLYPFGKTQYVGNGWLDSLNTGEGVSRLTYWNDPDPTKVKTTIFYSDGVQTLSNIKVGAKEEDRKFYPDGKPMLQTTEGWLGGDGTVPGLVSARLDESGATHATPISGIHASLMKTYAKEAVAFIDYGQSVAGSDVSPPVGDAAAVSKLSVIVEGRVIPLLTAPSGLKSGIDSNVYTKDIPASSVAVGSEAGNISVANPANGTYTLTVASAYAGDYSLVVEYVDTAGVSKLLSVRGFIHAATNSISFTLNSTTTNKLTLNHAPQPPDGLRADAVGTGGLATRLSWAASSDPLVTGYVVYAKNYDEPYFAQVGSTTAAIYDTGNAWAADTSVKTRIYAVTAKKADGAESFLSSTAQNDDRDHDDLTDTEEATQGTNMSNPDSDADGLQDGEEVINGTNPLLIDSDGDGYRDSTEVQSGTDPLDPASHPTTVTMVTLTASPASPGSKGAVITFTAEVLEGSGSYEYQFKLRNPAGVWSVARAYGSDPSWVWSTAGLATGSYRIEVWARNAGSTAAWEAYKNISYTLLQPASAVSLTANAASPQSVGNKITFIAAASGDSGTYEYQFRLCNPAGGWSVARTYGSTPSWVWNTAGLESGSYKIEVWARNSGSTAAWEAYKSMNYTLRLPVAAVTLNSDILSPQIRGTSILFTASATGTSGSYLYQFRLRTPSGVWSVVRDYSSTSSWTWTTSASQASGSYKIEVWAKNSGSNALQEAYRNKSFTLQ